MRLSSGESRVLSLKSGLFPPEEVPRCVRGSFSFFKEGFSFADEIINDIIRKGISPVFIDEIGPLELYGNGHHNSFLNVLKTGSTVYFTVRKFRLEDVISFYSIQNYNIIKI